MIGNKLICDIFLNLILLKSLLFKSLIIISLMGLTFCLVIKLFGSGLKVFEGEYPCLYYLNFFFHDG